MCGAIVTSPFDVVKTRLQSDLFSHKYAAVGVMGNSSNAVMGAPRMTGLLYNFAETGGIIRYTKFFFARCFMSYSPLPLFFYCKETFTEKNHYELYTKG